MPGEIFRIWFRSLLSCSGQVFRATIKTFCFFSCCFVRLFLMARLKATTQELLSKDSRCSELGGTEVSQLVLWTNWNQSSTEVSFIYTSGDGYRCFKALRMKHSNSYSLQRFHFKRVFKDWGISRAPRKTTSSRKSCWSWSVALRPQKP